MIPRFSVLHYVGYDSDRGGIVSVVRALAAANRFDCVLGMNAGFQPQRTAGMAFETFAPIEAERLNLRTFWIARRVARQARAWLSAGPQRIFHGHSRAGLAVAWWLHSWNERRVVVSVHCYGHRRWFYRAAARQFGDRIFWLTPAMRHYYRIRTGAEGWDQCIPGCVVATPEVPSPWLPLIEQDRLRLLGVGTLVTWKRWHLVLDALAAMPEASREKIRFVHVGGTDGSAASTRYAEALKRQTAVLRLEENVEWRGEIPTVAGLWHETDALVVASDHEPFSVAMLEALFAGVPVVTAASGGARDVVETGRNGWLFRSGDPKDLARVLVMLVESDARTRVHVDRGPLARFTADVVARQWQAVYEQVSRE